MRYKLLIWFTILYTTIQKIFVLVFFKKLFWKEWRIVFILGSAFVCFIAKGQQLPMYSQYTFNAFLLNPAEAGAEGYTSINVTNREQWFGVNGAPHTSSISIQARTRNRYLVPRNPGDKWLLPKSFSGKLGYGFYLFNDQAGLINQTGAQLTSSYHILSFRKRKQLSFGLTLSFLQYHIRTPDLKQMDATDNVLDNNRMVIYVPDANFGIYYTDATKFIGCSILQLSQASRNFGDNKNNDFTIYRHMYFIAGYKYAVDYISIVEPSFYIKSTAERNLQLDATLKYMYDTKFWMGVGYRTGTGSTFIASVGMKINRMYVGYAYDYSARGLLNKSYGSHELMATLKLGEMVRPFKWLGKF